MWAVAALTAAILVATGDVLLATQASEVRTPPGALLAALLAAIGLYGAPALGLGLAQALVSDSLQAIWGQSAVQRARRALADEEVDLRVTALVLAGLPTTASRLLYVVLFGLGSLLGMAALSGLLGVPLARASGSAGVVRKLGLLAGVLSTGMGVFWGATAVRQLVFG